MNSVGLEYIELLVEEMSEETMPKVIFRYTLTNMCRQKSKDLSRVPTIFHMHTFQQYPYMCEQEKNLYYRIS